jgi:hypothetical protein
MDPEAAWANVEDRDADLDDRCEAAEALIWWLDCGGFVPTALMGERDPIDVVERRHAHLVYLREIAMERDNG